MNDLYEPSNDAQLDSLRIAGQDITVSANSKELNGAGFHDLDKLLEESGSPMSNAASSLTMSTKPHEDDHDGVYTSGVSFVLGSLRA